MSRSGVLAGGTMTNAGVIVVSGTTVLSATTSVLSGAVVGGDECEIVLAGGSAVGSLVSGGGRVIVQDGGTTDGTIVTNGGSEVVMAGGTASCPVISSGGIENAASGTLFGAIVSSGGVEVVDDGCGNVNGTVLLPGGTLYVANVVDEIDNIGRAAIDQNDLLTVQDGVLYTQQLAGSYVGEYPHVGGVGAMYGETIILLPWPAFPCFCRGTLILTVSGERPVEDLRIGEHVITAAGAARPIRWIGRRAYVRRPYSGTCNDAPVVIRAGALDDGIPRRDLLVSPQHALFLDGALFPAATLVNGVSVCQTNSFGRIAYFHVELDTHDVILAEGAAAETFADDDSRLMFDNAATFFARYPQAPRAAARYCASRIDDGWQLEAVRRRLAARLAPCEASPASGALLGALDDVGRGHVRGWARDSLAPDRELRLRISDNGVTIGEVRADGCRPDLQQPDFGRGRRRFAFTVPGGLSPTIQHEIRVRRAADGAELANSPWLLESRPLEDPSTCRAEGYEAGAAIRAGHAKPAKTG